jgi:hypothetical protein
LSSSILETYISSAPGGENGITLSAFTTVPLGITTLPDSDNPTGWQGKLSPLDLSAKKIEQGNPSVHGIYHAVAHIERNSLVKRTTFRRSTAMKGEDFTRFLPDEWMKN